MKATPLWNSARFTLAIFAFLAFFNFYSLRINLSLTIVCMVNHSAILSQDATTAAANSTQPSQRKSCASQYDIGEDGLNNNSLPAFGEDGPFVWDKETQGIIHGSLFWGFILTNLAGGVLATRYGGKHVIGLSLVVAALLTLLVPVVSRANVIGLIILRFLTGASQGFVSPAMQSLWTHWAPPLESSRLRSFCFAGSQIAKVITYPISGLLCEYGFDGGWPAVFYLQGVVGVVWFIAWSLIVYDSPAQHPRITPAERRYIESSLTGMVTTNRKRHTPWSSILRSTPVWAIIISHTCSNWGEYTFLTNMPTYIKEVLQFDIKKNGLLSSVPYIGFWIIIVTSSWLADFIRTKKMLSTTTTRKLFNSIGKLIPAAMLVLISFVDCSQSELAIVLLTLGVSMTGFQYGGGLYMNAGDIAPSYAGVIYGISNTVASLPGFLAPMTIGFLTPDQTQEQWRMVFYISAAIYVLGTVVFVALSQGVLQDWAADPVVTDVRELEENQELNEVKDAEMSGDDEPTSQKC